LAKRGARLAMTRAPAGAPRRATGWPVARLFQRLFFVAGPRFPDPLPDLISQLLAGGS